MDARRVSAVVPRVRQVGFVTPNPDANQNPPPPSRTQSVPAESSSPPLAESPAGGNSLSPVMIPPPRHHSDNLAHLRSAAVPVPESSYRRPMANDRVAVVGSYNPADTLLGDSDSPNLSENSDASTTLGWFGRNGSGKFTAGSSFPGGGFDLTTLKSESITGLKVKQPAVEPGNAQFIC